MKVALISLGCAKNLVNSEQMLFLLRRAGVEIVGDPAQADVAVLNTCGFIDSAKSEAIDNILQLAQCKAEGGLQRILVAGCLAERYREEIIKELPEVDGLIGCGSFDEVVQAVQAAAAGETPLLFGSLDKPPEETERIVTTGTSAYIKIAEGCDNRCAYCVIPYLRGPYRSRPMEKLVAEAEKLAADGVQELLVVAQDITRYGTDLYGRRCLAELLEKFCAIEGFRWVRLHYLYPDEIDDALIEVIAREKKILPYLDIPIQHSSDKILKAMNRRGTGGELRDLLRKLKARIPDLVLRTSLIVGFPGEGEAEFQELCSFLQETKMQRAGVFAFSPEEGTPAALMPDRPDEETVARRLEILQELQSRIMDEFNDSCLGRTLTVLCEGQEGAYKTGRSWADSPDVDGRVLFTGTALPGSFTQVKITGTLDGDLVGQEVLKA